MGLFRQEVIDWHKRDWLGSIALPTPAGGWIALSLGAVLIITGLLFLVFGSYTRHKRFDGILVSSAGILPIESRVQGTIAHLRVSEGQRVAAGTPLFDIVDERFNGSAGAPLADVAHLLASKRKRLVTDLAAISTNTERSRRSLLRSLDALEGRAHELIAEEQLQARRAESANAIYRQWATMTQSGVISKVQLAQQFDQYMENEASLSGVREREFTTQKEIEDTKAQLDRLRSDAESHASAIAREIYDVDKVIAENASDSKLPVSTPSDGIVANVSVHEGQSIVAGEPIMSLLPTNSTLEVEVAVAGADLPFVKIGDEVALDYAAFPSSRFGSRSGHIISVGLAPLTGKAHQLGDAASSYRVRIHIDRAPNGLADLSKFLMPGMGVGVDIRLEKVSLMDWITGTARAPRNALGKAHA